MAKPPGIDKTTLQIMERMLRMPPKPHSEMKLGKAKPNAGKSPAKHRPAGEGGSRLGKSKT